MGGALHPGVARAGAGFELARFDVEDGRLVVTGWWSGLRGIRFVRPALLVDGRQILATLEHKPWAALPDGSWTAAFPWSAGEAPDASLVTLVVAPSVEVPLDREAPAMLREVAPQREPQPEPAALPLTRVEEVREPLRDELVALERRIDAVREELHEARAVAAERESRCRELEQLAAAERRAAAAAGEAGEDVVRAHAMAVLDRDRALAQLDEAVGDREAAVRARARMEAQRNEALAQAEAANARRDEALAERDAMRRQRDEVVLAHETLRAQLTRGWAQAERAELAREPAQAARAQPAAPERGGDGDPATQPLPPVAAGPPAPASAGPTAPASAGPTAPASAGPLPPGGEDPALGSVVDAYARRPRRPARPDAPGPDQPSGVRVIPAARTVGADLHRARRERDGGVTKLDMWAIRVLGSVAAVCFIALLVMILKAFFVF